MILFALLGGSGTEDRPDGLVAASELGRKRADALGPGQHPVTDLSAGVCFLARCAYRHPEPQAVG